jgi:hypothetical protein
LFYFIFLSSSFTVLIISRNRNGITQIDWLVIALIHWPFKKHFIIFKLYVVNFFFIIFVCLSLWKKVGNFLLLFFNFILIIFCCHKNICALRIKSRSMISKSLKFRFFSLSTPHIFFDPISKAEIFLIVRESMSFNLSPVEKFCWL